MEIILAIVVASAVIFFGALISMGNERQRMAIDDLREQVVLWATQDLKIKREHLARTVQVPEPLSWLNKAATKVCGFDLQLQVLEMSETPQSLICTASTGNTKVIFSPLSPVDLHRIKRGQQNRLSHLAGHNPLLYLRKGAKVYEMSVLNSGCWFDLEVGLAWKGLTGHEIEEKSSLWMYIL